MPSTEVEFLPDERAVIDWLRPRVKKDNALAVSDTVLIEQLQLSNDTARFFTAKMRLVTAGAISLFVDGNGRQVIQLNLPETPAASSRYVFLVVPLALARDVQKQIKTYRAKQVKKAERILPGPLSAASPPVPVSRTATPPQPPLSQEPPRKADHAKSQSDGQRRLGVRPIQPLRPPLRSNR